MRNRFRTAVLAVCLALGCRTANASTLTVTVTPSAPLANLTTYTATIRGGSSGVKDAAGNALASDVTWSFTIVVDPGRRQLMGNPAHGGEHMVELM